MNTRGFTLLKIKRASGSGLTFTGCASTGNIDRMGDRVEPRGAKYKLPLPLLWAHDHKQPVGTVTDATVTDRGIRVSFMLVSAVPKAQEAAALIAAGALALSIGFQALESEPLANGGRRYSSWSWHELSLVAVPANEFALIDPIGKGLAVIEPEAAPAPPIYIPCFDLQEEFQRAVTALPADLQKQVSEFTSGRTNFVWNLRDESGTLLAEVQPLGKSVLAARQPEPKALTIDDIGEIVGDVMQEKLRSMKHQIADLNRRMDSLQGVQK